MGTRLLERAWQAVQCTGVTTRGPGVRGLAPLRTRLLPHRRGVRRGVGWVGARWVGWVGLCSVQGQTGSMQRADGAVGPWGRDRYHTRVRDSEAAPRLRPRI